MKNYSKDINSSSFITNKTLGINKKNVITFIILFIIASVTLIGFFPMHYATDTYNIINIGYEEYMMNNSLKDGRIIMGILVFIANVFNMPIEVWIPILLVIAIAISCLTVILLKNIVLSYKPAKNKWIEILVLIISYCTIFNFMYLENLYFAECAVMALSVLAYILSAKNIVKKHYVKALLWAMLGIISYQGTVGTIVVMTLLFSIFENNSKVKDVLLDIIKSALVMLAIAVLNIIIIKSICAITGMSGDRTESIQTIINNIKYILNNFTRVLINTGGLLQSGVFIFLLSFVSLAATILYIIYSQKSTENLVQLIVIILISIASAFIASVISLSGFNSGRIRFTIGALIGVLFIHMYCKSNLFEKIDVLEIIFTGIVLIYLGINIYNYVLITLQHSKTNEFEKFEASQIEAEIEEYETENSIVVDKICVIRKSENNYTIPESQNKCVLTYIATRCEWGIKGALQYYEGRRLNPVDASSLAHIKFNQNNKRYECIGDTLYINVSVY